MVGFVQNVPTKTGQSFSLQNHQVQCFYGKQEKHYDIEKTKAYNTGKMKYNKVIAHHNIEPEHIQGEIPNEAGLAQQNTHKLVKTKKRANMHLEHKPSDEMDLLISAVNEADLGWKADVCKYQKTHALYGDHCEQQNKTDGAITLAQVKDEDDTEGDELVDGGKKEFGVDGDKDFEAALAKAQSFMKKYSTTEEIPDSELPTHLDFRDIDGYDFTSYFRDQGHCGSCYTISFT